MIADVSNTKNIGDFLPSINVKSVDIYEKFAHIHYFLEDEITNNFSFRWFDEPEFFNRVFIRAIAVKDKNLFNELLKDVKKIEDVVFLNKIYKQNTLEFLLENPESYSAFSREEKKKINTFLEDQPHSSDENEIKKNLGESLYTKIQKQIENKGITARELLQDNKIVLADAVNKYKDIREITPEILQNGSRKYYFFNKTKIDIQNEKNVYIICFSYLQDDIGKIKVIGKINNDIVLENNNIVKTFLYEDTNSNLSKINEDPENFKKIQFSNFKVKDLRIFEKKANFKRIQKRNNTFVKGKIYISRSSLNEANGILKINFDHFLNNSSEIYKYFNDNEQILSIIRKYSKIKSFKISRKKALKSSARAEDLLEDFSFPITKDSESGSYLISLDNELLSLREIKKTNLENISTKERFFIFKDKTSKNLKRGKYFYSVQLSVFDGSRKFIYKDILEGIQNNKQILNIFLRECYNFSLLKFGSSFFNEKFYEIFEQKYKEDLVNVIESLTSSTLIFYPEETQDALINLFSSCLHPLSSNVELVEKIFQFNNLLETFISNLLNNIEKIDPYNVEIKQKNIAYDAELEQEILFNTETYDAETPEGIGIEYLNYNPVDIRRREEQRNSGIPIYNKAFLDTRVSREIRRFFINEAADINFNGSINNDPYKKYLNNQTINSTKLSYFSPAFFDFVKDSYDFVSLRTSNNNFSYLEAELRAKNLSYASKDKYFNSFYSLLDSGITVNEINGKQRIISGTPDLKNPSILEDYSKNTKISSKSQLEKINFIGLLSSISSKDIGLLNFFSLFDKSSENFILKQLTNLNLRLTDEEIREIVKKYPMQIKSLLFKNLNEVADQINIDINREKNNLNFYSKAKIDYNMIKKIEFLEKSLDNEEVWLPLDDFQFNKLKLNNKFKYIICRLTNYFNDSIGEKIFNDIKLPVFNEYFLIDLENQEENLQNKDNMTSFKEYNIRIEDVNTYEPVSEDVYTSNMKQLTVLF